MSECSEVLLTPVSLYEEYNNEDAKLDLSSQDLDTVPNLKNKFLSVLYLQNNKISYLPDDFFPSLPSLMWLDLRDNQLLELPTTILEHSSLTHLLLQNNKLATLPNELGTVLSLKVLQLSGNPLIYPSREVLSKGTAKTLEYLNQNYIDTVLLKSESEISDEVTEKSEKLYSNRSQGVRSYNSVIDRDKLRTNKKAAVSIQFNDKDEGSDDDDYAKRKEKCPKLAKSRIGSLPPYYQSSKYLKPLFTDNKVQTEKMRRGFLRDEALKKYKSELAAREKILQGRRNKEWLKNWRHSYRDAQLSQPRSSEQPPEPKNYPYDVSPEYMTFLSRADIEKDLPDKYRRRLYRKSKPSIPRKSPSDVHLAMKIKQLFENLEAIDLDRRHMTPRTEQKVLLGEIQKISEIKQKLMELSESNVRSVSVE